MESARGLSKLHHMVNAFLRKPVLLSRCKNFTLCFHSHLSKEVSHFKRIAIVTSSRYFSTALNCAPRSIAEVIEHQKLIISKFVTSHKEAGHQEWTGLIDGIFSIGFGGLSLDNIDYRILSCCSCAENLSLARSYLEFIKQQNRKVDGAIACEFLKVCYNCKKLLNHEDDRRVSQFTEFLQTKYEKMDSFIGEGVIKGLMLQNKSLLSFEVLKNIKQNDYVNEETYTALAMYLIENNNFSSSKHAIRDMTSQYSISEKICKSWLEKFSAEREQVDELLNIFRSTSYKPTKAICTNLIGSYQKLVGSQNLVAKYGTISDCGRCSTCGNNLNQIKLSHDEYVLLKDTILRKVLVGQDIYNNTMPYELKKFDGLMDLYGPFDVIVDGLNVAYITGQTGHAFVYVELIKKVLRQLNEKKQKIFFIGKWHMRKWPGLLDTIRRYNARYFFVEDISADDLYILSATLYGEENTCFISRDGMFDTKLELNSREISLFERWRQSHQMMLRYSRDKITILPPLSYEMIVQQTANEGWHIPYRPDEKQDSVPYNIHPHKHWLCLQPVLNCSLK